MEQKLKKIGKGGKCCECRKSLIKNEWVLGLELIGRRSKSNRGFFHKECFIIFCKKGLKLLIPDYERDIAN